MTSPNGTPWTIKRLLDFSTDYFKKFNIEWPHLEAEILLAHALKLKRIDLYIKFEQVLTAEQLAAFKELIKRRSQHEPIAYITGTKSFMSLDLKVNRNVLIPRPETEKLVETAIEIAKEFDAPKILDIGTGSGAVAVSFAKYIPSAEIAATDITEEALELAKENANTHKVLERIKFTKGDLFEPVKDQKFDIIVFNPPYIPTADIETLAPDIKDFEPRQALDGGSDGLDYIRKIIDQAENFLANNGYLIFEIGIGQAGKIVKLIEGKGIFEKVKVIKDLAGIDRVILIKKL